MQFRILRAGRMMQSKLKKLDFRSADFGIFKGEIRTWKEGWPKKSGSYSRITSPRLKKVPSQETKSQAKMSEGQRG